jgi:hypothetical protein
MPQLRSRIGERNSNTSICCEFPLASAAAPMLHRKRLTVSLRPHRAVGQHGVLCDSTMSYGCLMVPGTRFENSGSISSFSAELHVIVARDSPRICHFGRRLTFPSGTQRGGCPLNIPQR